jgi:hypothetical protein
MRQSPASLPAKLIFTALLLTSTGSLLAEGSAAPANLDPAAALATRGIASQLLNQLGQKLKAAMTGDGPLAAVSVCKEAAPAIAQSLSAENGVQITRVGTRVRNSKMGVPNTWQKEALNQFEERLTRGEPAADLEYWQVVESGNGKRELHYAKAIMVQPMCLSCHGQSQDISTPLAEKIRLEYPDDQATGYSVGKLRGAVVVTKPL